MMKNSLVLEFAYKNDTVSTPVFCKATLEKYRRNGYLRYSPYGKNTYWLTTKGLNFVKKQKWYKQMLK